MKKTTEPLESLSEIELKQFIAARISGLISDAVYDTRTRYEPETLLIRAYQTTPDEEFKARFRCAVAQLLCDEWYEIFSDGRGEIKGEYLSRLLYLVELFRIKEAQPAVSSMAFNFKEFANTKGYYTADLAVQVLAALVPLQDEDIFYSTFWQGILEDKKWWRYGDVAFTGLRFYGFGESLRNMPLYIKAGMEYPEDTAIDIGVMCFVKQYRDHAVLSAIADRFAKEPADMRQRLLDALKDIPSIAGEVAKIEPRLTQTQSATVSSEPIRNGLPKLCVVPAIFETVFSEGATRQKQKPQENMESEKPPHPFPDDWKRAAKLSEQRKAA